MRYLIATLSTLLLAVPAVAKLTFAAYDGPPIIQTGNGGTRVDNHGIEVWTSGTPTRRYQVLGTLDDARHDKLLSGDAMSSSSIANKVREVGGDALILSGQDSTATGFTGGASASTFGNSAFGTTSGRVVHRIATRFVVVRYLDAQR